MSLHLSVELRDNVVPEVERRLARLHPDRLHQVLSEPMRVFWRNRLRGLGKNKRGWPSTGFWESAARSVQAVSTPGALVLRCAKLGVRQRWLGGPIKPQRAQALAIPISPVSYGHRPSEFPGLFLIRTARGAYLVQHAESVSAATGRLIKRERGGGNERRRRRAGLAFLFKLSKGVVQKGDPRVVPTADEFTEVALATVMKEVKA